LTRIAGVKVHVGDEDAAEFADPDARGEEELSDHGTLHTRRPEENIGM
jgi:hypothetical protein